MPLSGLKTTIDAVRRAPEFKRLIYINGSNSGETAKDFPYDEQFSQMAVSSHYDGRTTAHWQQDRHAYVRQYKNSTYMAIGAIAKMVAMQGLKIQEVKKEKSGFKYHEVEMDHPLRELFERVNPIDTTWDLWFYMVGWRLLTGCSMVFKARNGFGTPRQLWPMPSQWAKVIPDPQEYIAGYEISGGIATYFVPSRDMIHIKQPSLDWSMNGRFYGDPSIRAAADTIELETDMLSRLRHTFQNFAPPGMVFSTDQRLQPAQVRQLWANLAAQHSTSEHSGRPMVVHSGLKLEGTHNSQAPTELDYIGSLDKTLEITLATHGVPSAVLGMVKNQNKASMIASLVQFCKMTVDPILEHFSQHLTQDLAVDFGGKRQKLRVKIGPCVVDREDQLIKIIEVMIKGGAIKPNEIRQIMLDMDPLDSPHGDKAVMVSGFQAIDPSTGMPENTEGGVSADASDKNAEDSAEGDSGEESDDTVKVGAQSASGRN